MADLNLSQFGSSIQGKDLEVTAHFNKIVIVQSLAVGKFGLRLAEDLEPYLIDSPVRLQFGDVNNKDEFLECLEELTAEVAREDWYPILHLETHGDPERGLELSSGEFLSWESLIAPLTRLNYAMRMNLIVSLSACHGYRLIQVLNPAYRGPCWGILGPFEEVRAGKLKGDYLTFYKELVTGSGFETAFNKMNAGGDGDGLYYFKSADQMFREVWVDYLDDYLLQTRFAERVDSLYGRFVELKKPGVPEKDALAQYILSDVPAEFERSAREFFMIDRFPENQARFNFDFDTVLQIAEKREGRTKLAEMKLPSSPSP